MSGFGGVLDVIVCAIRDEPDTPMPRRVACDAVRIDVPHYSEVPLKGQ